MEKDETKYNAFILSPISKQMGFAAKRGGMASPSDLGFWGIS